MPPALELARRRSDVTEHELGVTGLVVTVLATALVAVLIALAAVSASRARPAGDVREWAKAALCVLEIVGVIHGGRRLGK